MSNEQIKKTFLGKLQNLETKKLIETYDEAEPKREKALLDKNKFELDVIFCIQDAVQTILIERDEKRAWEWLFSEEPSPFRFFEETF